MSAEYKIKASPKTIDTADAQARPLLEGAKAKLGFVPNMYAHMAKVPGVLSTYIHGYEFFRGQSGFTPAEQEVVLLTISRENGCEYCVSAHSMIAENVSKVPADALQALRDGKPLSDARLAALSNFTAVMLQSRGKPSTDEVQAFLKAGFEEEHILQIVLAMAVKTLSNYANHVNHPELDEAFSGHAWKA
ncbi:putative peroxidase-related enzyme [Natronocella acetinitrilica]|jgi:uncharacterized peroxidase-related enzyme|uniref:Peroxidase-related enzyme n=1 Tax=Natronocella acetinitrilica TaxID=414046 RepID=A0AAE3GA11_9GAMM|nr:carboxymuconolactone decarboxylase family protein [Natronocella acetinitrilica]MCP1676512.1 putative peroxidase-related enzyme [Natronocella acetinitrilica]